MVKRSAVRATTLALSAALTIGLSGGVAQAATDRPATQEHICVADTSRKEMAYAADNHEKPQDTRYVEELNSDKIEKFNEQLVDAGNDPLPKDATKLEFRTDGSVIVHLSDGTTQKRHGPDRTAEESGVHPMGVKHEIKKVVAGCLGVSVAALSSWGAMVEQFATWQKATKFLVRRFGVIGAVSCAGGIIWKYI